ncbi:hypothetical protein DFJ73DRAFT_758861 [Zopfochytrium polystomum]|nr:hypothetical protein DFJ73DRAFT_758861 [Zopfochytrium polystomum]
MLLAKSVVSLLFIATILIAAVWSAVADPSTPGGSGGRNLSWTCPHRPPELEYRKIRSSIVIERTPVESAKISVLAGSEKIAQRAAPKTSEALPPQLLAQVRGVNATAPPQPEGNQIGSGVGGIDACPGSGHQQQAVVVKEESAKAASFMPCCCRSRKTRLVGCCGQQATLR